MLRDDPQLLSSGHGAQHPRRVLLDRRLRLTPQHRLVTTARTSPVLVATCTTRDDVACEERRRRRACGSGGRNRAMPSHGRRDRSGGALEAAWGTRHHSCVGRGAGSRVHGAFFDAALVDRVQVILAPKLIGGSAFAPDRRHGLERMADACVLRSTRLRRLGADLLLEGCLTGPAPGSPLGSVAARKHRRRATSTARAQDKLRFYTSSCRHHAALRDRAVREKCITRRCFDVSNCDAVGVFIVLLNAGCRVHSDLDRARVYERQGLLVEAARICGQLRTRVSRETAISIRLNNSPSSFRTKWR